MAEVGTLPAPRPDLGERARREQPPSTAEPDPQPAAGEAAAPIRPDLLLVTCGAVLMLTQIIAVREIGSALFPTELVTILSTIMVLSGPSLAYAVADRVSDRALAWWGGLTTAFLLIMPVGIRFFTGFMVGHGGDLAALGLVFCLGGMFTSAFFAVFLPRLTGRGGSFRRLYALELAGALTALGPMAAGLSWGGQRHLFFALIVLTLHLALQRPRLTLAAGLAAAGLALAHPTLDARAAEYYGASCWDLAEPRSVAVAYSPYQRIEVMQDGPRRLLLLDGLPYYDVGELHWFNHYIAELPGRFFRDKGRALVVGSGSLGSTAYLVRQGFEVVTVDLDRQVAEFGMTFFHDLHGLATGDFQLRTGDIRRVLAEHPDERYDLIVLDIPAAFHLHTALLYTPEFLGRLKERLSPGGMVALNTTGSDLGDGVPAAIIRGACQTFAEVMGVRGGSLGLIVLYCGTRLPMTVATMKEQLLIDERQGFEIFPDASLRTATRGVPPHTADHLAALLMTLQARVPGWNP
ncbi:MAG: hypothetical protein GX442_07590 [Candidatus Riflebacteria bacterium]|nr:hypothetical protein [Candidatus Riflebacteria bacterium]